MSSKENASYIQPSAPIRSWVLISIFLLTSVLSGVGLFGKQDMIRGVLHVRPLWLELMTLTGVFLPLFWPLAIRYSRMLAPIALAAFAGTVLLVYPHVVELHKFGRGSDQADCVIAMGNQLLHGSWPYQRDKLWSHNAMSCGPGWIAIQAPLIALFGYRLTLLAIWTACLTSLSILVSWKKTSALIAIIFLSPGIWLASADGTDFLTFGICIATITLAFQSLSRRPFWLTAILGLVTQFRLPTLFLPLFMERKRSKRSVIMAALIACATFTAFMVWHPRQMIADGPVTVLQKFGMDARLSDSPLRTAVLLLLAFGIGLYVSWKAGRYRSGPLAILLYLLLTFGLPAVLDLSIRMAKDPISLALRNWNGGPWLVACIPLSACLMVYRDHLPESPETIPQAMS